MQNHNGYTTSAKFKDISYQCPAVLLDVSAETRVLTDESGVIITHMENQIRPEIGRSA
jgi:hypothetical protein